VKIPFTKPQIDSLRCTSEQGRAFWRDTVCRGLVVEVRATGGKTYYLSYRDQRGKQRLYKLANAADITPAQARKLCDQRRMQLAMGTDIAQEKQAMRSCPTVRDFFYEQYLPYAKSYKRSWATDISYYETHIDAVIGVLHMDRVGRHEVIAVMQKAGERLSASSSYRLFVLLRYMFNLALRWDVGGLKVNPTKDHALPRINNHRERYLSRSETQSLLETINASRNPMLRYIIPMLLLTGARKREVLDAQWADFDIERRYWRIPFTKSGTERYVPLSDSVIALLAAIPRRPNAVYVFANPNTKKPYVAIYYSWHTARRDAGLADVRLHDLRHSFASFLVNAGCSLYEVQKLLGHSSAKMTQRYSHLSQPTLLRAVSLAQDYVYAGDGATKPF
jgi:integrase